MSDMAGTTAQCFGQQTNKKMLDTHEVDTVQQHASPRQQNQQIRQHFHMQNLSQDLPMDPRVSEPTRQMRNVIRPLLDCFRTDVNATVTSRRDIAVARLRGIMSSWVRYAMLKAAADLWKLWGIVRSACPPDTKDADVKIESQLPFRLCFRECNC